MKKFLLTLSIVLFSLLVFGQDTDYTKLRTEVDSILKMMIELNLASTSSSSGEIFICLDSIGNVINCKDTIPNPEWIPYKEYKGQRLTMPTDSGDIEYLPIIETNPYDGDVHKYHDEDFKPSLDMWDSLYLDSEFQIIYNDDSERQMFEYSIHNGDTTLYIRDSLATIKYLINQSLENYNQINQAYDILKYVNTDGEIIDKKRFKQAVKKFNEQ